MAFAHAGGMSSMLKEGATQMSGIDEAVLKNIEACKQLAVMVRTSMGPNGMNKMVINHLEKLFVTSDARTIVTELEVQHPAELLPHTCCHKTQKFSAEHSPRRHYGIGSGKSREHAAQRR